MGRDLSGIFKAYDVRGVYPDELDEDVVRAIGTGFARFLDRERIVAGRDMRPSSPALFEAFCEGAAIGGATVVDVGLISTDGLYFASGRLGLPGVMFTASHNPSRYNGLKMCRERAVPISSGTGMEDIRALSEQMMGAEAPRDVKPERVDVLSEYADHCRGFIDEASLRPIKVAVDAGNGMAGKTIPTVFDPLPFEVLPLYFDLDGSFPNHPANPIESENLVDLQKAVLEHGCDVGIAFDGDADRMFLVDEEAQPVTGSTTTALVAERMLRKNPGASIIYNLICSWSVPEVIQENGGTPIRTRVGHSFIKKVMADTGAVFGGEHSGHYYFKENFRADSGMITALLVLEALCLDERPLSQTLEPYERYASSGEINSEVTDQQGVIDRLSDAYANGKQDTTDGLTVEFEEWWFNARPSNTEPLLRLNLEARSSEMMVDKRDEVLGIIRSERVK